MRLGVSYLSAILYLSDVFVDEVMDEQARCLQDNRPWDVGMASLLENFTVLTPVAPYFYQTGGNEGLTNRVIVPTPVIFCISSKEFPN